MEIMKTQDWFQIEIQHTDVHRVLQGVAALLYERGKSPLPVTALGGLEIQPAVDDGFLVVTEGEVSFADTSILQIYAAWCAAEKVAQAWSNTTAFAEIFGQVERQGILLGSYRKFGGTVLIMLAEIWQFDVIGKTAELAELALADEHKRGAFWNLYPPFCEALPSLIADSQALIRACNSIISATKSDLAGGLIFRAVEEYASQSAVRAEELFQLLIANPGDQVASLAVNVLCALAVSDRLKAHKYAFHLTELGAPELRRVGIATLGRLPYVAAEHVPLLAETATRFEEILAVGDPKELPFLAHAYGNLLEKMDCASQKLVILAEHIDSYVKHAVASELTKYSGKPEHKKWVEAALVGLADVSSENKGTFQQLDHCAYDMLSIDAESGLSFIELVVNRRHYRGGRSSDNITKLFEMTFSDLYRRPTGELNVVITRWFASGNRRLHRAAQDIIDHRGIGDFSEHQAPFRLNKSVLDSLTPQETGHLVLRLLGYGIYGPQLAALVLSATQREPCPAELQQLILDALYDYVLYNYPGSSEAYLKSRIEADDATEVERYISRTVLEAAHQRTESRRKLPPLKEFQPSSWHVYLVRLAKQKHQAKMMDQADEQSVFLDLVHRAPLKYGRSFFFEREGTFSEPTPLQAFEHSVELPIGELIDPVGQAYQRLMWQSVGLDGDDQGFPEDEDIGEPEN